MGSSDITGGLEAQGEVITQSPPRTIPPLTVPPFRSPPSEPPGIYLLWDNLRIWWGLWGGGGGIICMVEGG